MTGAWEHVAAAGTDPRCLRGVVTALADDPAACRGAVREALAADTELEAAVRGLVATPSLPGTRPAVDELATTWRHHDVHVAVVGDPGDPVGRRWPGWSARPWLVATRGVDHPTGPAVAIVGARRATPYGSGIAAWIAESCGRAGVRVVSGGAVGIDAAAHEAAVTTIGGTTVVLGCGHDVPYPRPHHGDGRLFARVLDAGGTILSESLPGDEPLPFRVRDRNRLLAALADVVVVVEGGARSGSLLTATAAAELGVPVLAVPGDVRAPGSAAPHGLLAEGAGVCREPADVLALVGATSVDEDIGAAGLPNVGGLSEAAVALLVERWPRPVSLDDLGRAAAMPAGALLGAVTRARVDGMLAQGPEGLRLTRRPGAAG